MPTNWRKIKKVAVPVAVLGAGTLVGAGLVMGSAVVDHSSEEEIRKRLKGILQNRKFNNDKELNFALENCHFLKSGDFTGDDIELFETMVEERFKDGLKKVTSDAKMRLLENFPKEFVILELLKDDDPSTRAAAVLAFKKHHSDEDEWTEEFLEKIIPSLKKALSTDSSHHEDACDQLLRVLWSRTFEKAAITSPLKRQYEAMERELEEKSKTDEVAARVLDAIYAIFPPNKNHITNRSEKIKNEKITKYDVIFALKLWDQHREGFFKREELQNMVEAYEVGGGVPRLLTKTKFTMLSHFATPKAMKQLLFDDDPKVIKAAIDAIDAFEEKWNTDFLEVLVTRLSFLAAREDGDGKWFAVREAAKSLLKKIQESKVFETMDSRMKKEFATYWI